MQDYQQNLRQKAEELQQIWIAEGWEGVAARSLEISAETAHAVNGPQLSKGIIDAMLEELGVIPPQTPKSDISCSGE